MDYHKEVYRKNVKSWGFFFMVFAPFIVMSVSVLIGYFIANDESSHMLMRPLLLSVKIRA